MGPGGGSGLFGGDGVDLVRIGLELVERQAELCERGILSREAGRCFYRAAKAADDHGLAGAEFLLRDRFGAETGKLRQHQVDDFRHSVIARLSGGDDRGGLLARRQGRVGAVGEAALDADLCVEARRVAAAEHVVGHGGCVIVVREARGTGAAQEDSGLADLRHVERDGAGRNCCSRSRRRRRRCRGLRPGAERFFRHREAGFGRHVAGDDEHRIVGTPAGGVEGREFGLGQAGERFRGGRAAIGSGAEQGAVEGEAADGAGLGQLYLDVVERLLTGAIKLFLREGGVLHDICHYGEGLAGLVGAGGDRDIGGVRAGACADRSAEAFDFACDLGRRAGPGAARGEIGRHGGEAGLAGRVIGAAGRDAQAGAEQRQAGLRRHDDAQAVGERLLGGRRHLRRDRRASFRRKLAIGFRGQRVDRDVAGGDVDLRGLDGGRVGERIFGCAVLHFLGEILDGDGFRLVHDRLCDALDVLGGDALQPGEHFVGRLRVAVEDHAAGEIVSAAVGAFAPLQGGSDQLVARLVEFGGGDRCVAHARNLCLEGADAFIDRLAVRHDHIERIDAWVSGDVEVGADVGNDLLLVHQGLVEPRRLPAQQDGVHEGEGRVVRIGRVRRGP